MLARFKNWIVNTYNYFNSPSQKEKLQKLDLYQLKEDESIYSALENYGLLAKPRFPISLGMHLIPDGNLGLSINNGMPQFLAPGGRHTLWSVFNKYLGMISITEKVINLESIQIVTIDQGNFGLATSNGKNHILKPGRYILRKPYKFIKSEPMNAPYVELGTHRIISVPQGTVAIVQVNGKKLVIKPNDVEGLYTTDADTFSFHPSTGFKSIKIEEVELNKLRVNTMDPVTLEVVGLIRYQVVDPEKAFLGVNDIHNLLKQQAESTLTAVFGSLSVNQISNSLSVTNITQPTKDATKDEIGISKNLIDRVTHEFLHDFRENVRNLGVELTNLNILSLKFTDELFVKNLSERVQRRMVAQTDLDNLKTNNQVAIEVSERERQQRIIAAEGEAQATKIKADAEVYKAEKQAEAAKRLNNEPLARELALREANAKMMASAGNNTIFLPHGMAIEGMGSYSERSGQTPLFWQTSRQQALLNPMPAANPTKSPRPSIRRTSSHE